MPLRRRARSAYQGWARGEVNLDSLLSTRLRPDRAVEDAQVAA
jgi:hypothetical protein